MKKKILHFLLLLVLSLTMGNLAVAQQKVDFTLRYNPTNSVYEVYAKPQFTGSFTVGGGSQLSVIVPASYSNASIAITSAAGGPWGDNSQVYAPSSQPTSDFHSITTNGTTPSISFVSGTETLIYSFSLGGCISGVRLYRNVVEGTAPKDPDSDGAGMEGSDFSNYFAPSTGVQTYNSNYNNVGTSCTVAAPDLTVSIAQPTPSPIVGQISQIPVTVRNIGTLSSNGIISVSVPIPAGTSFGTFPSSNNGWACSTSGTTATCINSDVILENGSSVFNVPFISAAAQVNTALTIPASTVSGGGETNTTNNTSTTVSTPAVVGTPDLVVAIAQPNPSPIVAGQSSSIPVTVRNIGTLASSGTISVSVPIPTGTSFGTFPTSNNEWTCTTSGTTAICTSSAALGINGSSIFNVPFISTTAQIGMALTIPASIVSGGSELTANNGNNTSETIPNLVVVGTPDLTVSIAQPDPSPMVSQVSLIPVTVRNTGTLASNGEISVSVPIPTGTSFGTFPTNNNGWVCTTTGTTATCKSSSPIAASGNITFSVPFVSSANQVGTSLTIPAATVNGGGEPAANNGNNASGTVITPAVTGVVNLAVTLSGPAKGTINTNFDYSVQITNNGSIASNGIITVKSILPAGLAFLQRSGTNTNWSCSANAQVVTCNSSNLSIAAGLSNIFTFTVNPTTSGIFASTVNVIGGGDPTTTAKNSNTVSTTVGAVGLLSVKAFLQGPFNPTTGLMNDGLRVRSLIPLTQPYNTLQGFNYAGTESIASNILAVTGNNAIVDWVMVEIRNATTPSTIVARRAGLIQRDGDIVDTDGSSSLTFSNVAGNYYVSVRHRNHLGVMTSSTVTISSTTTNIDFTKSTTANYSVDNPYAQYTFANGTRTMWSGNASGDNNIIFQGPGSDVDYILSNVYSNNSTGDANYVYTNYNITDFNLDGDTIYQGPESDTDIVFFNVLYYYLSNIANLPNAVIAQQIP